MHPIVTDMTATDHRRQRLAEAAEWRRGARRTGGRAAVARRLAALAVRLDPHAAGDLHDGWRPAVDC